MLIQKFYFYVRVLVLLLVVASEGKKKKNRKKESQADEPVEAAPAEEIANLCDIVTPSIIYCYCDNIEADMAEEGNCWIFNDTSDDKFQNVWELFASQTKIKHLTLHLRPDGTLKRIPTVAILHLPDLQWFEVQYATIHTAHTYSFGNSSSIEKVSLARNSIKILEPYSFANLKSLSSIILGENHLTEINRTVFSNLPKLTTLFIDRNNITSIEDFAFQELKNLKELELFSNQIQAIVPETFKGLYSLERLDLHKNWIEVLGDMTFQDLKSLKYLDLKGNSIKFIAPKSFYGLNKLQSLILQDNKLLSLGSEIFKYTENLLLLDLRQNVLETLNQDTVEPLLKNFKKAEMQFYLKGNIFRCDTRLLWIFSLYNSTKSRNVQSSLDEIFCYLETGTLPPRLEGIESTPLYEITTMGIGPRAELLKLLPSELPDPLIKTPATFTQEEDCDHEHDEEAKLAPDDKTRVKIIRGKGRGGRGRGKKNRIAASVSPSPLSPDNQQNDMAAPHPSKQKGRHTDILSETDPQPEAHHEMQPAAPVQESRPYSDSKENGASKICDVTGTWAILLLLLTQLMTSYLVTSHLYIISQ